MTAALLPARVPAGIPGGGRFAPKACRAAYAALDALAAAAGDPDPVSTRVAVPAPRCVHGSFARWAARNCCAAHAVAPVEAGPSDRCTGRKVDGDHCTRRTTRLDSTGRAACHLHGGRTTA